MNEANKMYQIAVEDLKANCSIGISEQERSKKQQLKISARLELKTGALPTSDRIEDALSYSQVKKLILKIAEQTEICLLETLAAAILEALFDFEQLCAAKIEISKPEIWENGIPAVSLSRRKALRAPALPQGF